jgi:hypothetical protein
MVFSSQYIAEILLDTSSELGECCGCADEKMALINEQDDGEGTQAVIYGNYKFYMWLLTQITNASLFGNLESSRLEPRRLCEFSGLSIECA